MDRPRGEEIAIGAGLLALIAALAAGRLPRWLRVVFVLGVAAIGLGIGFLAYREYVAPVTLTVVTGSLDGESTRLVSAIATRMASANAPVRLKVVDKGDAKEVGKAFLANEANVAVVRADTVDLPDARAVLVLAHAVVLVIALPGHSIDGIEDLKGKTIGVVGATTNQRVIAAIAKEYDLDHSKIKFVDIPPTDLTQALRSHRPHALLVVAPISYRYLSLLRSSIGRKASLVAIDAAAAIAAVEPTFESHDIPKGTLRGAPPLPEDDLTTLRVPYYLVANKRVSDDAVTLLTKAVMDARRDLMHEHPLLTQIASPGTDKDALMPIHPGAAAYFDGEQKTFFDKYGDQLFYGSMLLGTLTSLLAAAWKFMTRDGDPARPPLGRLQALVGPINAAGSEAELAAIESEIGEILGTEFRQPGDGGDASQDSAALVLMAHRLEGLIERRRAAMRPVPANGAT